MPDKKAAKKRDFYIEKIKECKAKCEGNAFTKYTFFELKELQSALKSVHEKFENKCLAVQCDAEEDLDEQYEIEIKKQNAEIDALCLQLKAKISKKLDESITKAYALPKASTQIECNEQIEKNDEFQNQSLIDNAIVQRRKTTSTEAVSVH